MSKKLTLGFHGRIIDHLGIQMYQSPTAAIAEIVSNAWDADAEEVRIDFNFAGENKSEWTITIQDNGIGMTFDDCQTRYLSVGYNRREKAGPAERTIKNRPVMGRKGIGKFAGFGIARFIKIRTVSKESTELTEFELDLQIIRQGDSYVSTDNLQIDTLNHAKSQTLVGQGTQIILRELAINKRISDTQFAESLARRFAINATADNFRILLNGNLMSDGADLSNVEMSFPKDLSPEDQAKRKVSVSDDGWGEETLPSGRLVKWKIQFYKELVKNEEMAGITIFAHKKLAQRPFMFNVTGGLASQAGPEYMSGQVIADWVDELGEDVISTERQRLNWEHSDLDEFQKWGEQLIRRLMSVWKAIRTAKKMQALEDKVSAFSDRLKQLGSESKIVKGALQKLAQLEKLTESQFIEMGSAILLAWEGGRLRELINDLANSQSMDEAGLVELLTEANAITALHTAETVKSKLMAIEGLKQRVKDKELENAIRNYIAKNPWLISPQWETFAVEKRVNKICAEASKATIEKSDVDFNGRVDLVLSSGRHLVLLEFMRPGLPLNGDHLERFNRYLNIIKEQIQANTALGFENLTGYLVADKLDKQPGMSESLKSMKVNDRYAMNWDTLIAQAEHQWKEFLGHVKLRVPDDARVQNV